MKKILKSLFCIVIVVIMAVYLTSCFNGYSWKSVTSSESLVQVSTIDALLNGVYDGVIDFKTLKIYGDFGIGTFDRLDGEMIGYDNEFYQIKADGKAYPVSDAMTTPFASVTFFDTDRKIRLIDGMSFEGLQEYLDGELPTDNIFYALKIEGTFSYMKTRSVPAQKKPYPLLVEVTKNQPEFEFYDVSGTIVGFYNPPYVSAINVPGYHLHFVTDSKETGGHILDFNIKEAVVYIDETLQFAMLLPNSSSDFYKIDLSQDKQTDLQEVEK
ncbi:MAG: acetolactate decarboxylase [Actinobacteria bacterium]|nr:acetolactate decarboxylase [Actinomycetota bacterium]